jgi:hypothetical protein
MTPDAITSALAAAQALFLLNNGQLSDNDLIHLSNPISLILLKSIYDHIIGIHNLLGLVANADRYLNHCSAPFIHPATCLACNDPAINAEASHVKCIHVKTAWAAKIQDYKVYEAAEHGIKVLIEAAVQHTWICDLRNPKTLYLNITALALFNHLCKHSGSLHMLDMVSLTIQMSQYYEGTPDIPKYIFLLEDTQRNAARACLPVTDQTLTVLASTTLLAADTFPCTTELWEELDPPDKAWAAWKTSNLAAHKKRANRLCATGGADNLGRANSAHANNHNPDFLESIFNAMDSLASTATNEKAVLEKLIAINSSLAISNSTLTNQAKALRGQLAAKTKGGGRRGGGSNGPNRNKRPDPAGYC